MAPTTKRRRRWSESDVGKAAHAARRVLSELCVRHPTETDIENLAFARGAIVRYGDLHGAAARLTHLGSRAIITVSNSITYRPRQRFAIAHELGHLETHRNENQIDLCSEEQISERYDDSAEREANSFASEFLMPRSLWDSRVDVACPTLDVVRTLADEFQTSFTAAAVRFAKLCPERCAVVYCKEGRVKWSSKGEDFGYWIEHEQKVDPDTLAYDYFTKGKVSSRQETISASAWLNSTRLNDDCDLKEHCCVIPSMNATLSLLWIPADRDF